MKTYGLHVLLFLLTCATTYQAQGPVFAATLLTILLCHEMGHYVTARRHGIDVSLPYFIPLPYIGIGTLGAVIRMRSAIGRRDALLDVGASGPLVGLLVAIPLLIVGLVASPVGAPLPGEAGGMIEGNSILYAGLKWIVKGALLPQGGAGQPLIDVQLGPMAMAAWVGLLVTFINLIPVGQLDGGHVAVALFGNAYERVAAWIHRGLALCGALVFVSLTLEARAAGRGTADALGHGAASALPWLIWVVLLLVMRGFADGRYHPPVADDDEDKLSPGRRAIGWLVFVLFILLFTPVPMREAL